MTEICDSLTDPERLELRQLLEAGLTDADIEELHEQGLAEVEAFGIEDLPGLHVGFCRSAAKDLETFGRGKVRMHLNGVLSDISNRSAESRPNDCPQRHSWVVKDGPFRIVMGVVDGFAKPVVFAVAPAGISPCRRIWRYFDHFKAMDLLKSGSLFFCRLDKLTGDPEEGRLTFPSKSARIQAYKHVFEDFASQAVAETEELFRGTTYVCCWTRRAHESYLAWRHYCGADNGGFAICTTHRRLFHFWHAQHSKDPDFFFSAVGYLRPEEPLPNSDEGEQMFWKRHWFSDEMEERMVIRRSQVGNLPEILARLTDEVPAFEKIPIDMSELVAEIVLNPFASQSQRDEIRQTIADRYAGLADRVRLSEIQVINAGQGVECSPSCTG